MRHRLLILGGTQFVGRHIVEAALDAGHKVTLFHRGQTNPDLFPACEHLIGDRNEGQYDAIRAGRWDAVIDTSAYITRHVTQAMDALAGRVRHYTFISTVSVYDNPGDSPINEESTLGRLDAPTEEVTGATYGPLKAHCEALLQDRFDGDVTVIRPGIVAGPHDPTDRFTYWVRAAATDGLVLGPPRGHQPVQVIHGRDLGELTLRLTVEQTPGAFNATGPDEPVTMFDLISACAEAAGTTVEPVWAPEDTLRENEVSLPLVLPADGSADGLFMASNDKARAAGLSNRSLVATASDTLAWDRTRGVPPLKVGPDPDWATDLAKAAKAAR